MEGHEEASASNLLMGRSNIIWPTDAVIVGVCSTDTYNYDKLLCLSILKLFDK